MDLILTVTDVRHKLFRGTKSYGQLNVTECLDGLIHGRGATSFSYKKIKAVFLKFSENYYVFDPDSFLLHNFFFDLNGKIKISIKFSVI